MDADPDLGGARLRAGAAPPRAGTQAAGQRSVRGHNLALALRLIADAAVPPSRADLAAVTGMTRATASSLVQTLVDAALVDEVGPTRVGAGRPAAGLVLRASGPAGLGLEVNVDYVATCVVDLTGAVRHREVRPGDQRGLAPAESVARLADLAVDALAVMARLGLRPGGVALGLPGIVAAPDGPVRHAPNLGWRDVDVRALVVAHPALRALPLTMDNEANFAALAELLAGREGSDFLHISGEVGIGAGIVLGGALMGGRHGWSGELGHVAIDPQGPPCPCGARGCLEQYAGQEAILRAASIAVAPVSSLGTGHTLELLVEHAQAGEAQVLAALARAGGALGIAVSGALNLLDVDRVVLGGIYGPLARWIGPEVEREVRARVLAAPYAEVTVHRSALDSHASVVGAASSVVRAIVDDPARWLDRVGA